MLQKGISIVLHDLPPAASFISTVPDLPPVALIRMFWLFFADV